MRKVLLLYFLICTGLGCKSHKSNSKNNDLNDKQETTLSDIIKPKDEEYDFVDSVKKLGGYYKKESYEDLKRCNFYEVKYILKKPILDSGLLANFTKELAFEFYSKPQETKIYCMQNKIVIAYLFMSLQDYADSLDVVNVVFSPASPNGHLNMHTYILNDYKKFGHVNH
jgi:hypothetical protein